ncbi:FAD dependent oxidoreductase [Hypomontagnella monticulosa]|nr:FAD dependent oxidoreductase [Hypomontagnella monticulosa]
MTERKSVAVVGAGIFGLSLAVALHDEGHRVTVFDQNQYDETAYEPNEKTQVASVDHNKIFRASYGKKLHYQRLALESRDAWNKLNLQSGRGLFVNCGMLRVQPTAELGELEKETLANMTRDGLRDTQFVKSDELDRKRAAASGWDGKLLDFTIENDPKKSYEAVLDSLAGYVQCSASCEVFRQAAVSKGIKFHLGPEKGSFASLVEEPAGGSTETSAKMKAVGLRTKDGVLHEADVVVIAAGSYSTQLLPDLAYHLESSAGSIANFKIDPANTALWDKFSPENFPVMTWKSAPRDGKGKDTGSVYVFPRTAEGIVKIGFRGIKFTNFQPAPEKASFSQTGMWSVPLPVEKSQFLPRQSSETIRHFVSIFLTEFANEPFHSTKLCWYTDSLDNSFVIDYVPTYADNSVFVCTGGSGHGAKFLPVLGKHAADIFDNGDQSSTYMREHWRWRSDSDRRNGLEDGPSGLRNIGQQI